jgi:hypothetical protein
MTIDFGLAWVRCSDCSVTGARDGNSIDTSTVTCPGTLFNPTALVPWAITWNATNTSGTIAIGHLGIFLRTGCLYGGTLNFTYSARTFTIPFSMFNLVQTLAGGPLPCPTQTAVSGTLSL